MRRSESARAMPVRGLLGLLLLALLAGCESVGGDDAGEARPDGAVGDGAAGCDCPEDDNPCTEATCGPDGECRQVPIEATCDDGDICTVDDRCVEGTCTGTAQDCDDGNHCTTDRCIAGPVCPDGEPPLGDACLIVVQVADPVDWTGARAACQTAGGDFAVIDSADANARAQRALRLFCAPETPGFLGLSDAESEGSFVWAPDGAAAGFTAWADGEPGGEADAQDFAVILPDGTWAVTDEMATCFVCTAPAAPFVCVNEPGEPAEVGLPEECNGADDDCDGSIDEGGGEALCDDADLCTTDVCMGAAGCLHEEAPLACDDGVACTVAFCDPATGCGQRPDDGACDDGIDCTVDRCDAVAGCVHEPMDVLCDDGADCTTDTCNPGTGCTYARDDAGCDDGIECTLDSCQPFEGCVHEGRNALCADDDLCTDDVCDPVAGCTFPFNEAPCDDGDLCTAVDRCVEGTCVGVEPLRCDDGVPCTADACDQALGCVAPLVGECDHPGPAAGYYEGPFTNTGTTLFDFPWSCTGVLRAVIDASREVDFDGVGEADCVVRVFLVGPVRFDEALPVRVQGRIEGLRMAGEIRIDEFVTVWNPEITLDPDGVPVRVAGETQGTIRSQQLFDVVGAGDLRNLVSEQHESPYRFEASLERQPVMGSCCGPLGCEPSEDFACYRRGGTFSADGAGECCMDGACAIRRADECNLIGGLFVPTAFGACCRDGNLLCDAVTGVLCDAVGGVRMPGLSCDDHNGDGLFDGCGVPENFGYTAAPRCTVEGNRLTAEVTDGVMLTLLSAWQPAGDGFDAGDAVEIVTPLGNIPVPEVTSLHVGCGDRFTLHGESNLPPVLGDIAAWPGTDVTVDRQRLVLGYGYGYEMRARGLEGPFADGRPYFFAHVNTAGTIHVGEGIHITAVAGDEATIAIDPTDPGFVFEIGGQALHGATANLVRSVGMGLSYGGRLTWKSARDLFDGRDFVQALATGHIYRAGDFGLIPLPGLPANIYVDGDLLVNAHAALEHLQPIARAVAAGDLGPLTRALGDPQRAAQVMSQLEYSGNANRLHVAVGPLDFDIGDASFQLANERFTFSGEGFTPGELLARGGAGPLFEAFSAITIRQAGRAWGFVEGQRFRFTVESDLGAGPFELRGVRLIIDSEHGIRIEGGSFGFDFGAFLDALSQLMTCEFGDNGARCSLAGIEVADIRGELTDYGFVLMAGIGVPAFGRVDLSATILESGHFDLWGTLELGLPGFQTTNVQVRLTPGSFAVATQWRQFGRIIQLSGTIGFDGNFELRGSGRLDILGFEMQSVDVTLSSRTGLHATGTLALLPGPLAGSARMTATLAVARNADDWTLTGQGSIAPFGYQLARVTISARAAAANAGISIEGEAGIGSARAVLRGQVTPNAFSLTGRTDLTISGYQLAGASITLDSNGLRVSGMLNVLAARVALSGRVEPNGDFRFTSNAAANLPLGGLNASINATFENVGGNVRVFGDLSLIFAGQRFAGGYSFASNGAFWFSAGIQVRASAGVAYARGAVNVTVAHSGFSARFSGDACVSVPIFSDPCVGASGSVNSDGWVCVGFPRLGNVCVDVL